MKFNFKIILFTVLIIAITYTGIRHTVINSTEKQLKSQIAHLEETGHTIGFSGIQQGGFPYRLELTLDNFHIKDAADSYDFSADKVTLISHVWTPGHWLISAQNTQVNLLNKSIQFTDETLLASVRTDDLGQKVVVIDSQDTPDSSDFKLYKFPGLSEKLTAVNWIFSLVLNPKSDKKKRLYEDKIANFRLQLVGGLIGQGTQAHQHIQAGEISGALSGSDLSEWRQETVKKWSRKGGLITIDAANFLLGTGEATTAVGASGTITLDAQGYPLGSFSIKTDRPDRLSALLQSSGLIQDAQALQTIKTAPTKQQINLMIQGGGILMGNKFLTRSPKVF